MLGRPGFPESYVMLGRPGFPESYVMLGRPVLESYGLSQSHMLC